METIYLMTPTRCIRDSAGGMEWNHNVNSGGGYCKLLEHCVCRRLSTKQQLPLPIGESSISAKRKLIKVNSSANKYIIAK